jgi:hypothetical protein
MDTKMDTKMDTATDTETDMEMDTDMELEYFARFPHGATHHGASSNGAINL